MSVLVKLQETYETARYTAKYERAADFDTRRMM